MKTRTHLERAAAVGGSGSGRIPYLHTTHRDVVGVGAGIKNLLVVNNVEMFEIEQ
jgi:hypothetical protein